MDMKVRVGWLEAGKTDYYSNPAKMVLAWIGVLGSLTTAVRF